MKATERHISDFPFALLLTIFIVSKKHVVHMVSLQFLTGRWPRTTLPSPHTARFLIPLAEASAVTAEASLTCRLNLCIFLTSRQGKLES